MFEHLAASAPAAHRRTPIHSLVSAVVHLALVAAAIGASRGAAAAPVRRSLDTLSVFVPAPPQAAPPATTLPRDHAGAPDQVVAAPAFDAPALPAIDALALPSVDVATRPSADAVARAAAGGQGSGPAARASNPGSVFTAATVDEPVVPLVQPAPRYPPVMAAARMSGFVLVEFVVDTLGKAEPGSTRALEASHEVLAEAATETILRSTFRPARSAGRPVRQLVRQRVTFSAP